MKTICRFLSVLSLVSLAGLAALAGLAGVQPPDPASEVGNGAGTIPNLDLNTMGHPFIAGSFKPGSSLPAEWSHRVSEEIRHTEYRFSPDGDRSWSAPNRAHHLRTRVSETGVEVSSRTRGAEETSGDWKLVMLLTGFGREGAIVPVQPAHPEAKDNRVEFRRDALTEWYVNDEKGLEQGFTIPRAPDPPRPDQPLVLEMSLTGRLTARTRGDGQSVAFTRQSGAEVLRYGKLLVLDANGRELEARFAVVGNRLQIRIDDFGATYPLTVDPLMTFPAWTAESNQRYAWFGYSVATAGDVNGDGFSDVIVGAYFFDNGEANEGRTFLYLGSASGLDTTPAWTAEGNQVGARFGNSVATAGDVNGDGFSDVIVGAGSFDNGQTDEGQAFLFLGSASGLGTTPAWTAEGNQEQAFFGFSVATAGDINGDGFSDVIIGATLFTSLEFREGRAFLYLGSASGLGTTPAWTAEGNQVESRFGNSVATAGDVNGDGFSDVIVGARLFDNGQTDEGQAFLFLGSASGLDTTPAWTAEGNQDEAFFGSSVATAGDINGDGFSDAIISAPFFSNIQFREGAAFVFLGSASGLDSTPAWTAEGNQLVAVFGSSVASAGDVNGDGFSDVIVGAPSFDNPEGLEGGAFLYLGSASGLATTPAWTAESDQTDARFGNSVATAGDVNGDGISDVIVGAFKFDNGQTDEGGAFAFLGSANGVVLDASCEIQPSSLNLQSEGNTLSIQTTLRNLWTGEDLDPSLLAPVFLSRISSPSVGDIVLPTPRAEPGCDDLTEDGIWETVGARTEKGSGTAVLRFNTPSDGRCETMDGNRQDIIALMLDIPDGEVADICYTSTHPDVQNPFECCGTTTVTNHGNR